MRARGPGVWTMDADPRQGVLTSPTSQGTLTRMTTKRQASKKHTPGDHVGLARLRPVMARRLTAVSDARALEQSARRQLDQAERALRKAVRAARASGASWARVAYMLQVSRQAAWERFGEYSDS